MNVKNKIHTARFKDLNETQDKFINARVTTPQTYDEIKGKGQATILKIASKGIVEKLLQRCEHYKAIITKKTETIKGKNELIDLLAKRLLQHEPDLFKGEFKEIGEQVEQTRKEEVKTGIENEKQELSKEESEQVKTDNETHEKETDPDRLDDEDEREPEEPEKEPAIEKCNKCGKEYEDTDGHDCDRDNEDIDDGPETGSECGGGGDDPEEIDEDKEKEDKDDEISED
jgi:hypothetical protein